MAAVKRVFRGLWQSADNVNNNHNHLDSTSPPNADSLVYNSNVEEIRQAEYPTLLGTTYLDHAGTTPYARSAIERWTAELTTNLFGNPHSASAASQLSTRRVDDIRLKVLKFFNASPEDFDVVFVANATAGIKLVAEAFRDSAEGFWYGYHGDAHTSLIGCRELASQGTKCFEDDESVESWLASLGESRPDSESLQLIAYPGQSNMSGKRLPLEWCSRIRAAAAKTQQRIYTLLDAASLVSTSPLDLSDASAAPDFTALSFYKVFGFPDLGALIVRKESSSVLMQKRYFAGGTVDAVVNSDGGWHAKKASLHDALEEGTLPFHNVLALDHAMTVHTQLFGSMQQVSSHTRFLAQQARMSLRSLRHTNGAQVCDIYSDADGPDQGPLIAFNLKDSAGKVLSASEVEKLCIVKGIQLRTGGLCNPGGIARHLGLSPEHVRSNYDAGRRCGGENDMVDGMPTGAIRISFGAMSTKSDLEPFIDFIEEYYVERGLLKTLPARTLHPDPKRPSFFIEALSVFPIKSCAAFQIPADQRWQVKTKGLAWDREWCLVHEGTNVALSQKRYPRMALLQPSIDLRRRVLRVSHICNKVEGQIEIEIDLDDDSSSTVISAKTCSKDAFRLQDSKVCGDTIPLHVYTSATINNFFSEALGVPCCLARYPRSGSPRNANIRTPKSTNASPAVAAKSSSMMLANESPMLIVSRSSVNELNRQIKKNASDRGELESIEISAGSFRANIVVAEHTENSDRGTPYDEDDWTSVSILLPSKDTTTAHDLPRHLNGPDQIHRSAEHAQSDTSSTQSIPSSSSSNTTTPTPPTPSSRTSTTSTSNIAPPPPIKPVNFTVLGPCQRCQMVSINQLTAAPQQEPFSTLAKKRRKGDGRVWFGVHAALDCGENLEVVDGEGEEGEVFVGVGDEVLAR
ncbi:hypothetical protein OHC33_006258 [Knufia fluminis]|uniref:Molybdenum cofactor sulfurase n=1 Tax=Knufia fluminis TaxID=191047 RepID=A0AAN8ESK5_9EURO|nr:hypothetical protein OHC33_006258 [Knufia fluminis]